MLELNYNYDNSDNLIEDLENEDKDDDTPILENNEETNEETNVEDDEENYDIYNLNGNLLGNFYNNSPDFQVQIIDISNLRNRSNDISRSPILQQLYNIDQGGTNLTSNFFINFIENNLNNIIQNSVYVNNDSSFIQNFINSTFELDNKKKFKRVTHDDELRKLKIQKFDNSNIYANNECPINLTKFEENDEIIILPCNHVYTALPIQKWLNEESNCCPTCRFELKYKEIKCEENNDDEYEALLQNNNESNEEDNEREEINPNNNYNNYNNDDDDENDIILQQILLNSYSSNNST
tara:strand:- start:286 stop:1170 length:885 start_codon:yes stop_codon:yes gene_type:complete